MMCYHVLIIFLLFSPIQKLLSSVAILLPMIISFTASRSLQKAMLLIIYAGEWMSQGKSLLELPRKRTQDCFPLLSCSVLTHRYGLGFKCM